MKVEFSLLFENLLQNYPTFSKIPIISEDFTNTQKCCSKRFSTLFQRFFSRFSEDFPTSSEDFMNTQKCYSKRFSTLFQRFLSRFSEDFPTSFLRVPKIFTNTQKCYSKRFSMISEELSQGFPLRFFEDLPKSFDNLIRSFDIFQKYRNIFGNFPRPRKTFDLSPGK